LHGVQIIIYPQIGALWRMSATRFSLPILTNVINFSHLQTKFKYCWQQSKLYAIEYGGTLVQHYEYQTFDLVNIKEGKKDSFRASLELPFGQNWVGIFHTHHNGTAFSGGDAAALINDQYIYSILQSGDERQYLFVRSWNTVNKVDHQELHSYYSDLFWKYCKQGTDQTEASVIVAREMAYDNHLYYYEGKDGIFTFRN
jgi:hypothetical protein